MARLQCLRRESKAVLLLLGNEGIPPFLRETDVENAKAGFRMQDSPKSLRFLSMVHGFSKIYGSRSFPVS